MKKLFKTPFFSLSKSSSFKIPVLFIANSCLLHNSTREAWMINRKLLSLSSAGVGVIKRFLPGVLYFIIFICHVSTPVYGSTILEGLNQKQVGKSPYSVRRNTIVCPDNTATRLPSDLAHPDAYVCCEDYDLYQELMEQGREPEARQLLLAPVGSANRMADIAAAIRRTK